MRYCTIPLKVPPGQIALKSTFLISKKCALFNIFNIKNNFYPLIKRKSHFTINELQLLHQEYSFWLVFFGKYRWSGFQSHFAGLLLSKVELFCRKDLYENERFLVSSKECASPQVGMFCLCLISVRLFALREWNPHSPANRNHLSNRQR